MKCPIDQSRLVMTERQGIEIDYCPACRGVWLDRGELDKIIERTSREHEPGALRERSRHPGPHEYEQLYDPSYRKKKSLLGEIFDF